MKKIFLCVLGLCFLLCGCAKQAEAPAPLVEAVESAADETGTPESADNGLHFTMYFVDPETSPYVQGGLKIAELVRDATDGAIEIEVIADSELGERGLIDGAMDNEIDIATCANSVLTNYIPQMNILDQAYLWKNADEAHIAVDGTLGQLIRAHAEKIGLHVIGFEESGFRNTFSTKPIRTMEDFQGITIRTMENKYHQAAFEAFGANPVPMAYTEVFGALQDGTIDACENATANCYNSGYYQITKNVTNTRHAFVYILLCMSDDAWNRIPENLVQPFLNAVQEGVVWEREQLNSANAEAEKLLTERGVQFHDIDIAKLQAAYQAKAAEKGFVFDEQWQAAVDEAVAIAAGQ